MKANQTKQTFKIKMLALVLALAITWYSINPAQPLQPTRDLKKRRSNQVEEKNHEITYDEKEEWPEIIGCD